MRKNTGKPSETQFRNRIASLGKTAFLERLADASDIVGRNKGRGGITVPKVISDYLLVINGWMTCAEVKSSLDKTAFRFSLISTHQSAKAEMVTIAGGNYTFFVHHIPTDKWYIVPFKQIQQTESRSIQWSDLSEWKI